jgi:hypothetical protein
MRGLVCGSTSSDEPVKDDRDDDDTAAEANQPSEQSGCGARNRTQKDQPKGAHRALSEVLEGRRTDCAMLTNQPKSLVGQADLMTLGFTPKFLASRYQLQAVCAE